METTSSSGMTAYRRLTLIFIATRLRERRSRGLRERGLGMASTFSDDRMSVKRGR